jgi:hypothetical protein
MVHLAREQGLHRLAAAAPLPVIAGVRLVRPVWWPPRTGFAAGLPPHGVEEAPGDLHTPRVLTTSAPLVKNAVFFACAPGVTASKPLRDGDAWSSYELPP